MVAFVDCGGVFTHDKYQYYSVLVSILHKLILNRSLMYHLKSAQLHVSYSGTINFFNDTIILSLLVNNFRSVNVV